MPPFCFRISTAILALSRTAVTYFAIFNVYHSPKEPANLIDCSYNLVFPFSNRWLFFVVLTSRRNIKWHETAKFNTSLHIKLPQCKNPKTQLIYLKKSSSYLFVKQLTVFCDFFPHCQSKNEMPLRSSWCPIKCIRR